VFTADFFHDDISHFLATMTIGRTGRAFVLSRDGAIVAGPPGPIAGQLDPPLQAALALLPNGLAGLSVGSPFSLQFEHGRIGYAAAFQAFTIAGGTEWVTAIVMPDDEFLGVVYGNLRSAAGIGLLAVLAAVALGSVVAYRIAAPLRVLAEDLEQAGQFKFSSRPPRASHVREVATLASSAETMKASLRSFGHYVPTEIVQDLLASGREARLGGETRCLTIHFSDVQGFVKIGEGVDPARLVRDLSEYLRIMADTLREHRGTVDKFLGDGILAFFNAPTDVPDHAALACRAAVRAQERLHELRPLWTAEGRPPFRARIGLHTGEVLVGNIGTPDRFEYTVIGDAVNAASRLTELAKEVDGHLLADWQSVEAAGDDEAARWRRHDTVTLRGRSTETVLAVPAD
jgi:adenylate cyclase